MPTRFDPNASSSDDLRARAASRLASVRSDIASFIVMDVMREAARQEQQGRDIIHMEVGQPATAAPKAARRAAAAALERDTLGYTMALGTDALRARIAALYGTWYGLAIDPARVVVTTGSSGAFVLAFLALFDAGARVGLPSPGYPCYRHILSVLGCTPVMLDTGPETRWMPDAAQITPRLGDEGLDGLLIASPANPTGTMLEPERLAAITRGCRAAGVTFISDEIYHGLTYERPAATALQFSDDAVVINSFSKYFSMTGWRVGWMIVPPALVRTVERLAQNLFIAPPAIAQAAALGAFDGIEELEANRGVYAANRSLLLNELPKAGFGAIVPADGAFYLYADVSHLTDDSTSLARRILDEAGVAVTPGVDFDAARGGTYLRFSYSGATERMLEAAKRLQAWSQRRA
ncbi:MAG: aminotransferase class I/II-fold pyridoxal phosphate-dependent enzyme [Hyphomicrobium sp.]